ncbi:hypothetical protein QTI24_24865 [Variovorax sp. J22P240]|uniref:hypothetical protein n=1 Tax=Variovorax sp. J22P240 TaxID=3053514 RepID=UPI0025766CB9|nr:hypothetical protein [Variovorax sp. J22P240]MDM0001864.1 hypothetical protein [Variovorax sp. J22P240]
MRTSAAIILTGMVAVAWAAPPQMFGNEIVKHEPLSEEQFRQVFRAGATVHYTTTRGHVVRSWTLGSDGTFVASTTESEALGGRHFPFFSGRGKWSVRANELCVDIDWRDKGNASIGTEKWCRAAYPINGAYYMAPAPHRMLERLKELPWGTVEVSN